MQTKFLQTLLLTTVLFAPVPSKAMEKTGEEEKTGAPAAATAKPPTPTTMVQRPAHADDDSARPATPTTSTDADEWKLMTPAQREKKYRHYLKEALDKMNPWHAYHLDPYKHYWKGTSGWGSKNEPYLTLISWVSTVMNRTPYTHNIHWGPTEVDWEGTPHREVYDGLLGPCYAVTLAARRPATTTVQGLTLKDFGSEVILRFPIDR